MRSGSAIINVTSTFAVVGGLRGGAYSAAKGGLTALTTHSPASTVHRHPVQRGGSRRHPDSDGLHPTGGRAVPQDQHRDDPVSRLGRVEDLASTVAFLCSDGGSFINGQTIVVDGGWSSTKYLSDFALDVKWRSRVSVLNLFRSSTRRRPGTATSARCTTVKSRSIPGLRYGIGRTP